MVRTDSVDLCRRQKSIGISNTAVCLVVRCVYITKGFTVKWCIAEDLVNSCRRLIFRLVFQTFKHKDRPVVQKVSRVHIIRNGFFGRGHPGASVKDFPGTGGTVIGTGFFGFPCLGFAVGNKIFSQFAFCCQGILELHSRLKCLKLPVRIFLVKGTQIRFVGFRKSLGYHTLFKIRLRQSHYLYFFLHYRLGESYVLGQSPSLYGFIFILGTDAVPFFLLYYFIGQNSNCRVLFQSYFFLS